MSQSREIDVLYVLPKPDFFSRGRRGRVSHALGVANGLAASGVRVHVLSGAGLSEFRDEFNASVVLHEIEDVASRRQISAVWTRQLISKIRSFLTSDSPPRCTLIRYAVSTAHRIAQAMQARKTGSWGFEVNSLACHQLPGALRILKPFALQLDRRILRCADFASVVSFGLKPLITNREKHHVSPHVFVVPNAADETLPCVQSDCKGTVVKFCYLGKPQPYYDFPMVINAFSKLRGETPNCELHFFGFDRHVDLDDKAVTGINGFHVHGYYHLPDLLHSKMLSSNDVLLVPCKDTPHANIVSPIKLFEYMALGLPIIASNVGQLKAILQDEYTAYMYTPDDSASLLSAMRRASLCCQKRQEMGARLRAEFLSHHTWKRRMSQFIDSMHSEGFYD